MTRPCALIFIFMIFSLSLKAQELTSTTTVEAKAPRLLSDYLSEDFSLSADLMYYSNFKRDDQFESSTNYYISASYQFTRIDLTTGGLFAAGKNLTGLREQEFITDNYLFVSHKTAELNSWINHQNLLRVYLPFNSKSRKNDNFRARLYYRPSLSFKFNEVIMTQFRLALSKYFHEYETNAAGAPNSEYSISPQILLTISPLEYLSWNSLFAISHPYDYEGEQKDEVYSLDTSLKFDITKQYGVSVGYINEGKVFKANGEDLNIDLFDLERGTFYLTGSVSL